MNRRMYDEMLADLLMEEVGAEVIDETAASQVAGLFAFLVGEPDGAPRDRIEIGTVSADAGWMWGGATRH
ncbi:MAG TPA: hypothetical protein PLG99_04225 [Kaistiaceae bacterium]|nr:hypothetical protein [Kaistiaceae bacterium]HQG29987.1 hypothetical protein [Candidatus Ozemobacteraceae bacterium]